MTFREKALNRGRLESLKEEVADIEKQLANGWIERPPDCYYRMLEQIDDLFEKVYPR